MSTAQFAMAEELASLIKDNLSCKHLVLSVEEALIDLLQNNTSPDGVLELEPMSPYHRLLLHRLADIYGFAHESVGEGNDRHLILERCPESSIPSVLVSDILWQYDHEEVEPLMTSHQLLKNEHTLPDTRMKQTSFPPSMSFEEREAAYLAARERIFSLNEGEVKVPIMPKQRNIPVVARRMIAHALGQRLCSSSPGNKHTQSNGEGPNDDLDIAKKRKGEGTSVPKDSEDSIVLSGYISSVHLQEECSKQIGRGSVNRELINAKDVQSQAVSQVSDSSDGLKTGCDGRVCGKDILEREQFGAAKRMFAHALGLPSTKENSGFLLKCNESNKPSTKGIKG